ncbi:PQQ-dependent sugar dehydrogenase [Azospirillum canadense]|uniref:PQQ-dependent sugar dehydrogenase n=1 Tax=Azospirillum canadense TaxID=403962 RepID=UPI0022271F84|nr:sorbosone dehydrogenase [Azospirillum canadense]MCW2235979.1 glucose/arabinose dehydrogenase [Azospirillum canadense]
MTTSRLRSKRLAFAVLLNMILAAPALADDVAHTAGDTVRLTVEDLPAPNATPSTKAGAVSNKPVPVDRPAKAALQVPAGFRATLFRDHVENARNLLVLPDGGVLVAQQKPGTLTLLRDTDGKGEADESWLWAAGFDKPFGLAFHEGFVYVADAEAVWRLPWREGATTAPGERQRLTPPGALGSREGHDTRSLAIAPDGKHVYVGVGSAANLAEEPPPRATIQEFPIEGIMGDGTLDGGEARTVATGLRNPVGMAFRPGSSDLYAVVNERDGLGDGLAPDFFTRVEPEGFYGWPYAYAGPNPQPGFADKRPDLVARTIVPDVLLESHSAPIGLVFADRLNGPARYRTGAFVALHGSSSRSEPVGYTVVFVPFEGKKPAGGYEVFASGFRLPNQEDGDKRPLAWGRPAGLAIAKDGSLLIADSLGSVWRVSYTGASARKLSGKR